MNWIWSEMLTLGILTVFVIWTILAHVMAWRHLRRRGDSPSPNAELSPISIIKPVRGLDQEAEENFVSFLQSEYPGPFEVIFCVEEREDPAVPLIQRLIANCQPPPAVRLVFSKRQDQRELGKTLNLIAGIKESSHDVLVLSDSDVRNTPGFLPELVRPLSDPRVGMSYACPLYKGAKNWVAGLMALAVNETPLALAAAPDFAAIGSAIAIRKDVLHAIGGLARLRHRIGIDAALGRAVRGKGYRIALIRSPVTIIYPLGRFRDWWRQLHRWLVTIRLYLGPRFLGIPFYAFPILWASLYLSLTLLAGGLARGLAVMAFVIAARVTSVALVSLFFAKEPVVWRYLWLLPALEILTAALWLESHFNPYVVWRGKRYRVMSDATVRPL